MLGYDETDLISCTPAVMRVVLQETSLIPPNLTEGKRLFTMGVYDGLYDYTAAG
jgi:hypothetical protein